MRPAERRATTARSGGETSARAGPGRARAHGRQLALALSFAFVSVCSLVAPRVGARRRLKSATPRLPNCQVRKFGMFQRPTP
eukprot:11096519-Alexandrium_andersonii.AAC.1